MTIKYHFFGKDCQIDRSLNNRFHLNKRVKEEGFNISNILLLNQIHGADVMIIDRSDKIYGDEGLPKCDAIVTNQKNIAIGVITADCGPILFFDEENSIVAAAHAGWRGAKLGVILQTVKAMESLGAKNIKAIIGPMIAQNSYEISKDFFTDFINEDSSFSSFFKNGEKEGKFLFNLPKFIEKKLEEAGVKNIENQNIDTYTGEENLFSFRRSTHKNETDCGRNISLISIQTQS